MLRLLLAFSRNLYPFNCQHGLIASTYSATASFNDQLYLYPLICTLLRNCYAYGTWGLSLCQGVNSGLRVFATLMLQSH